MSPRLFFMGLAAVAAAGGVIYLGLEAGAPDAPSKPIVATKGKSEPNKKGAKEALSKVAFKEPPSLFPAGEGSTPPAVPPGNKTAPSTAPAMEVEQILASLKQVDTLPEGPDKQKRRQELVAQLAAQDPHQALTYVETLTGDDHMQQKANVLGVWAEKDLVAATAYFKENGIPGGVVSDEDRLVAASIAKSWAKQDSAAAWSWVATLPAEARSQATAEVITRIAEGDPQAALHMITTLASPDERADAMQPLAAQWARSAPIVAAAWVSGLRDPGEQGSAASGLIAGWMDTSPRAASEWVSHLPEGETRDAAIVSMVQSPKAMKSPEAALIWASNIQNVELRNQTLPQVLQQWQAQDPAAAELWLSKHVRR